MGNEKVFEILFVVCRVMMGWGYNGFSFCDVVVEVGIKSVSIYYYFLIKVDLVEVVVKDYWEWCLGVLVDLFVFDVFGCFVVYGELFVVMFKDMGSVCLGGVFVMDVVMFLLLVKVEVEWFFLGYYEWLNVVF